MARRQTLDVEGRPVPVSNLEKLLFPASGFTKAHVIQYYIEVSSVLLPHLENRPVTMKRYPDGVSGEHFYEKDAPGFTPEWVKTFPVPRRAGGRPIRYILINDLPTLVWCANLANLELHPFLHRAPYIDEPNSIVFDLDPGEGVDVLGCAHVAFLVRDLLGRFDLESFPKVSGSKGLQLHVPLNAGQKYEGTLPWAKAVAEYMAREHPSLIVADMAKHLRTGKVFIDWSQNSDFKTTVGVYSLRAKRQTPFVSMPVTWEELEAATRNTDSAALSWQPAAAIERITKMGDLFESVLKIQQSLPAVFEPPAANRRTRNRAPRTLETYANKRNFGVTAEPAPAAVPRRSRQGGRRRFVVQKHAASHLHYDFRLEMHDVLKSWAVPKGVPLKPEDNRLAMATEDHPIEYLDFEGVIPEGQYGGGTVMVWDIGTYEIIEGNYYKGDLHIHLQGTRLQGEWRVVRDRAKGDRNWRLMKLAPPAKLTDGDDRSAMTKRTMEEIAAARDAVWQSNRVPAPDLAGLPEVEAKFVAPMQALLTDQLPRGKQWSYEAKFDGYRALALKRGGSVRLLSRNNRDLTPEFPAVVKALGSLPDQTTLDGELVALDQLGRPSFNHLQNRASKRSQIQYYVFDALAWSGRDLLREPLSRRRAVLEAGISGLPLPVLLSHTLDAHPETLVRAVKDLGLEGIIAKRADSAYEAGKRSGNWVKFKVTRDQELVVGGYVPAPKRHFDALLVGYYLAGELVFAGKIRNGFKARGSKEELFACFDGLGTDACPFTNLPEPANARRGMALTREAMKLCCWLRPELVVQVGIREWTAEGHLRHASFLGLRDDKDPREVVRE